MFNFLPRFFSTTLNKSGEIFSFCWLNTMLAVQGFNMLCFYFHWLWDILNTLLNFSLTQCLFRNKSDFHFVLLLLLSSSLIALWPEKLSTHLVLLVLLKIVYFVKILLGSSVDDCWCAMRFCCFIVTNLFLKVSVKITYY